MGFWDDYQALVENCAIDRVFEPRGGSELAQANFTTWQKAVSRAKNWVESDAN